jgi:hypothetical protein
MMQSKLDWSFGEVITGLFDQFILSTSMQDATEVFFSMKFASDKGVQEFYDELLDHMQNTAEHPNEHIIYNAFIRLASMHTGQVIRQQIEVEYTDLHVFICKAKVKEQAEQIEEYYNKQNTVYTKFGTSSRCMETKWKTLDQANGL